MSYRFILDPSMLLDPQVLILLGELTKLSVPGAFVMPGSFLDALNELPEPFMMLSFFDPKFDWSISLATLDFVRDNSESFEPFYSPPDDSVFYRELLRVTESQYVARILFEEWQFMNTESFLFARDRRGIDKIVEAGSSAITLPRSGAEGLIRRTLQLPDNAGISTDETLRLMASWVALGGPMALQILEQISGTPISTISGEAGLFLLFGR